MENYEQKYKELVGKIKKAYLYAQTDSTKAVLEDILPELAGSKDEKMRKTIIDFLRNIEEENESSLIFGNTTTTNMIAWLEKQGEKPIWTDDDRIMAFTLLRDVDQMTYISNEGKNERLEWLNSLEYKFNKGE